MNKPAKNNFLRYPGGKQKLLQEFIGFIPNFKGKYFEPFLGGASVFFNLRPSKAILTDINSELIELYEAIQQKHTLVWKHYKEFPTHKKGYYQIRDSNILNWGKYKKAARTLYLNRTCFKGMWRHNSEGKFNVGYGGQSRRWVISLESLKETALSLKMAKIKNVSYEETIFKASTKDFIFLDPPYKPGEKELLHNHYSFSKFSYMDQINLSKNLKELSSNNIPWLMINSNHADILKLYKGNRIIELKKGTGTKPGLPSSMPVEVAIMNY